MSTSRGDEEMGTRPNAGLPIPPAAAMIVNRVVGAFFAKKTREEDDYSEDTSPPLPEELLSADDSLAIFRRLTGISSSPSHKLNKGLRRPAANRGIYRHVVTEERDAERKYRFFSRLINGCLGLQIIVAAALTALGAGDGPHAIVTVFGAINTVIAGFLTYLKGSGLPNQAKMFQSEWSKLREFIEQRERDFGCVGYKEDVYAVVKLVENWYDDIRMEIEANTPDGYTPTTKGKERRSQWVQSSLNAPNNSKEAIRKSTFAGTETTGVTEMSKEAGTKIRDEKRVSEY